MSIQLDLIFNSLADGTRRDILKRLVRQELSVTEVAEPYDMSLAAVSKHLKVLERANLLGRRRDGKRYILRANIEPLKKVDNWIDFYRKHWEEAFDKLDDYLADLQKGDKKK
ncbi:MAG: ArsR/SmtB family transcription factor [Candidatus Kariarchaeaceae archaeon]|jgi:DNA-binding transcriptional ArsR family regulator